MERPSGAFWRSQIHVATALQCPPKMRLLDKNPKKENAARAVQFMASLVGESKPMTDTAEQLAEKLVALLFSNEEIPAASIPDVALAICEHTPTLQSATEEETQFIFNEICGALASRQLGRIVSKSARYLA